MKVTVLCVVCVLTSILFTSPASAEDPLSNVRAISLVTRRVTVPEAKQFIDAAEASGYNAILLGIAWKDSTVFNSTPWVTYPDAWTPAELLDVAEYARSADMEVIPMVPLLTHQKLFLRNVRNDLLYNYSTYDPSQQEIYTGYVFPLLQEIIDLLQPDIIHIGHDEAVGWTQVHYDRGHLLPGEVQLPANLFLADVQTIHAYLADQEVRTMMWGDMLIAPAEFPTMATVGLNGMTPGYGAALRAQIPQDVLIADWHYYGNHPNFPTINAFVQDGFEVLGATYDRATTTSNFSLYASQNGAAGMIATNWSLTFDMTGNWTEILGRIQSSGTLFLQDFPGEIGGF